MTLRAIQPNPSYDMLLMSSQRSLMPKKRKRYWSVSEIGPSPLKVDAAAAADDADDGRVGIWKAPLPDGTAELNREKVTEAFLRLTLPPLKVDAADDADGQVGIWKALLPDGTAELKSYQAVLEKLNIVSEKLTLTDGSALANNITSISTRGLSAWKLRC